MSHTTKKSDEDGIEVLEDTEIATKKKSKGVWSIGRKLKTELKEKVEVSKKKGKKLEEKVEQKKVEEEQNINVPSDKEEASVSALGDNNIGDSGDESEEKSISIVQSPVKKHHATTSKATSKRKQLAPTKHHINEEDEEQFEFMYSKQLTPLPKAEPDSRGNYFSSTYKYDIPISNFKIRVMLLKYPSLTQRSKWKGDYQVVEDRLVSWQEKIFSKPEEEFYSDKKNITTTLDERYHNEILADQDNISKYIYTYVESDLFVAGQDLKSIIRRCPVKHCKRKTRKFTGSLNSDLKHVNSEGESVGDDFSEFDEYRESILSPSTFSLTKSTFSHNRRRSTKKGKSDPTNVTNGFQDEIIQQMRSRIERKGRQKAKEIIDDKLTLEREEKEKREFELEESLRRERRELKDQQKLTKFQEMEQRKKDKEEEYVKRFAGSKRPSLALSARMKMSMTNTKSPNIHKKKQSPRTSRQRKGASATIREMIQRSSRSRSRSKSAGGSDQSESGASGKVKRRSRSKSTKEKSLRKDESVKRRKTKLPYKASWPIKRKWIRSIRETPHSMYIMVAVPHMSRRRRDMTVCTLKAYPKSGVIAVKPSFGYRVIEAKRNHVYRLSWELYCPTKMDPESQEVAQQYASTWRRKAKESQRKQLLDIEGGDELLFGQTWELFEITPANTLRLVLMGEILSCEGFDYSPLCVHYVIELPKGWRNDSLHSLQGITHNSYSNNDNIANFSHDFFCQLNFALDSLNEDEIRTNPIIFFMVVSMTSATRVRFKGYGYLSVPSKPGIHLLDIKTWKLKPRTIREEMDSFFLNISPSLQDIRATHIPSFEDEECHRANRLGLQTQPSGSIKLRLQVIHQSPSIHNEHSGKLELLEKMSSSTILKSVQYVIEAFQRARKKAHQVKNLSDML